MKFLVYGAGNTGHALAAYLADKKADVVLYTRDPVKAEAINNKGITAEGDLEGTYNVAATACLESAVRDADCIIVMTQAGAHRAAAEAMLPYVRKGQTVLVFNSNWGALEFKQVFGPKADDVTIAETGAQLFVASMPEPCRVRLSIKAKVTLAACDKAKTQPLVDMLSPWFPQLEASSSILETTLGTTNPVIHVPVTIMNAARAEKGDHFLFYADGVSRAVVELILKLDRERMAVAKALGVDTADVLSGINSFWPQKHDDLYDALTLNPSYQRSVGPKKLDHRFLSEDIPFGIAPISEIGRVIGIPTPDTDALLSYLRLFLPESMTACPLAFTKEDLGV